MTRVTSNPARRGSFWAFIIIGALIFGGAFAYYKRPQPVTDPGEMRSQERAGESIAGKNAPSSDNRTESGRAEAIQKTEQPRVTLSAEQKQRLADLLKREQPARGDSADFSVSIGSTVPRQVQLSDLPDQAADVLHGYSGDQYMMVGDQLVIVDREARRIVALIPKVDIK
jgi:hypothetical protein